MSDQPDNRAVRPLRFLKRLLATLLVLSLVVLAFARFGAPEYMPDRVFKLAQLLKNPRIRPEVPLAWVNLCRAWDTWLGYLVEEAPRLLETEALWEPNDALRKELANVYVYARELRPATLVPQAAGYTDYAALAASPPPLVLEELQLAGVVARVGEAGRMLGRLQGALEGWPRWRQLRQLAAISQERGMTRLAAGLQPAIPPQRGNPRYRSFNTTRTLIALNRVSRDDGMLQLSARWSEFSRLSAALEASSDPAEQTLPARLVAGLTDQPTLVEFAASLAAPIGEMRRLRPELPEVRTPLTAIPKQRTVPMIPLVPILKP
jgi:hypothetical protein